jgi:chaperonin cofactor prefoldin
LKRKDVDLRIDGKGRKRVMYVKMIITFTALICLVILLPVSSSISQQMYRWTDDKGTVHFTDDPSKIPDRYSDQTKTIEAPETPPARAEPPVKPGNNDDRVKKYLDNYDRKIAEKRELEKKAASLEEELRYCEARLKEIDQLERQDFNYYTSFRQPGGHFVPVGSPYYDEKVKLEKRVQEIKPELESLHEKISQIRRSL